jgi:hypothetical protein
VVGLRKVSSLPEDEILDGEGCVLVLVVMLTASAEANATATAAPFCYPVAGYTTAYYYDYRDN